MARPRRSYSEEDKKAALRLAATIGLRPACRELDIAKSLLAKWQQQYPELWSDLRAGRADQFRENFTQRLEELAVDYADTEQRLVDRALKILDEADARETATLIKAIGSSRQGATITARQARGEPDKTLQLNIDFPMLEAAMERILNQGHQPALPVPNLAEDNDG
jgi:transposase-like protein